MAIEPEADIANDDYFASQWTLMWHKFRKHKLAMVASAILIMLYILGIFSSFFATNEPDQYHQDYVLAPPQGIHFVDTEGNFSLRPFVYGIASDIDPDTWETIYKDDTTQKYSLSLFPKGHSYKLFGLFNLDRHFIGVEGEGKWFLFGTDEFGRDMFSRTLVASQISLFIGIIGVFLSFLIGSTLGGLSGYLGGKVDIFIQRLAEFVLAIPTIPLWMALAAALPSTWSSTQVFFGITLILSMVGWANLSRVVRGKTLELRESDFVLAARLMGVPTMKIIVRHILPSFASYLIVSISLGIPGMILAETALSFLQIGIKPPSVSWGVLLQTAQSPRALSESPWLLIPGIFVVVTVLCYNFIGDGLRDAADPYK
ncbi:ABC transporter permease [Devosia rhodophyticola]|uniref:ABC transporter permease n=1 Tax=Devosia rhodophyticola TaxID=3026423 RepID=UPI002E1E6912